MAGPQIIMAIMTYQSKPSLYKKHGGFFLE
jgi:hypothetical protein